MFLLLCDSLPGAVHVADPVRHPHSKHSQRCLQIMCPYKQWTLKEAEIYAINGGILQLQLQLQL